MLPRRFGLRARVITAFGVGALLLSVLLSAVTYQLTLNNLLEEREEVVFESALRNAQDINRDLFPGFDANGFVDLLQARVVPEGAQQGMVQRAAFQWTETASFERRMPAQLVDNATSGQASQMVFQDQDETFYAVVLPLPRAEPIASYLQIASLAPVEETLGGLLATLVGASAVTTVLGLGFGIYVATRLFNPLAEVSNAAAQIAQGDLSTKLEQGNDPDLDQLTTAFNDMTTALEERIVRDARFASDVSHELRSPLMTLTGSVAVLEGRRNEMPERAQLALDLLSTEVGRFKQLVEDLLEISRFDIGAIELERDEVLLTEFVKQALHAANSGRRTVPIVHGPGAEDLIAMVDKRRIAQVIRNLSENADKYADGVTQARINLIGDTDTVRGVTIELEDEGPGVPVDERELIFERFSRGSESNRRGTAKGVGLGLSLVVEHLRLHGGSITVTDRVDGLQGARFVIELPGVVVDE